MPQPWTAQHELHIVSQVERKPNETTGWWEARPTGRVHLLCNCGLSTGWINRAEMPSREELHAQHGTPIGTRIEITEETRTEIAEWLTANGIDPDDVPLDSPIVIERETIDGDQCIRYTALRRNSSGAKYVDLTTGDAAKEQRTALLKVEPPENVQVRSLEV